MLLSSVYSPWSPLSHNFKPEIPYIGTSGNARVVAEHGSDKTVSFPILSRALTLKLYVVFALSPPAVQLFCVVHPLLASVSTHIMKYSTGIAGSLEVVDVTWIAKGLVAVAEVIVGAGVGGLESVPVEKLQTFVVGKRLESTRQSTFQ